MFAENPGGGGGGGLVVGLGVKVGVIVGGVIGSMGLGTKACVVGGLVIDGGIVTVSVSVRVGEVVMIKDGVIENVAVAVTTCGVAVAGGCVGMIVVPLFVGSTGGVGVGD